MTNSSILASNILLFDNWPGPVKELQTPPKDGFDGSEHSGVTTPAYRLGEKVCVYDETGEGWATFIYLKNVESTTSATLSVGSICSPNGTYLYRVDQDPDDNSDITIKCGLCAVALTALTNNQFGWFWCGGVAVGDTKWGSMALRGVSLATIGGVDADGEGLMLSDLTDSLGFDTWTGDLIPCGTTFVTD